MPVPVIHGISLTLVLDLGSGTFTSLNSSFFTSSVCAVQVITDLLYTYREGFVQSQT